MCGQTSKLNLNSITHAPPTKTFDIDEDFFPNSSSSNVRIYAVAYLLVHPDGITTGYVDLTDRFPKRSSQGNKYILVGYQYDANAIQASPIKDRTASSIINVWEAMHNQFKLLGITPETYMTCNTYLTH